MTATPLAQFAVPSDVPWMARSADTAVCAQTDPELWFPEKGGSAREARRLCRSCPFLAACRSWTLAHPSEAAHGVWGGLTARQRARILANQRRAHASESKSTREAA